MSTPPASLPTHSEPERSTYLRLVFILVLYTIGFLAFRCIVVDGTLFDKDAEPSWMAPKDDLSDARRAVQIADFNEAERILNILVRKEPNYGAAHELLGYIYLQRDRYEKATKHYRIALLYHPDEGGIAKAIELVQRRSSEAVTTDQ